MTLKKHIIKWGMIGCGDVAKRLSGVAINKIPNSKLEAVLSKNFKNAKNFAKKNKVKKYTSKLNTFLNYKHIDIYYIATPPNSHFYYIKKLAPLKKIIICEKPLTRTLEEAKKAIKICKKNRVNLFVPFYRRTQPRYLQIKKWLDSNQIGKIIFFSIKQILKPESHPTAPIPPLRKKGNKIPWRFIKKISGGGNYVDMGVHSTDIIDFLIGPLQVISSNKKNLLKLYNVEDTLSVHLKIRGKSKCNGVALFSSVAGYNEDIIEIYGTKGYISFTASGNDYVILKTRKKYIKKRIPFVTPRHLPYFTSITNKARGQKIKINSDYKNAMRSMILMHKLIEK